MNDILRDNLVSTFLDYLEQELSAMYEERERQQTIQWLFHDLKNWNRADLVMNKSARLSESEILTLHFNLKKLKQGEPIQYVVGEVDFFGLQLRVNPSVLIPRPETEELVKLIITENNLPGTSILDIGTGSGCIAIALKKLRPQWKVSALDVSVNTLNTAEQNARLNEVMIQFEKCDILHSYPLHGPFDIIVSNPPYVLDSDKFEMADQVLNHEPHQALFVPDADPLLFYRRILEIMPEVLKPEGKIYFEIHESKGNEMKQLVENFPVKNIHLHQDMQGKDRMLSIQYNPN
jgi:release factor glutamine methyltransferase